jgi:hypothetical protein
MRNLKTILSEMTLAETKDYFIDCIINLQKREEERNELLKKIRKLQAQVIRETKTVDELRFALIKQMLMHFDERYINTTNEENNG